MHTPDPDATGSISSYSAPNIDNGGIRLSIHMHLMVVIFDHNSQLMLLIQFSQ